MTNLLAGFVTAVEGEHAEHNLDHVCFGVMP